MNAQSQLKYILKRISSKALAETLGTSPNYVKKIARGEKGAGIYNTPIDTIYNDIKKYKVPSSKYKYYRPWSPEISKELKKSEKVKEFQSVLKETKGARKIHYKGWQTMTKIKDLKSKKIVIKLPRPIEVENNVHDIMQAIIPYISFSSIAKEKFDFAQIAVVVNVFDKILTGFETTKIDKYDFNAKTLLQFQGQLSYVKTSNIKDIEKVKILYIEVRMYQFI